MAETFENITEESILDEKFTIYSCPHYKEPFAEGILMSAKVICSYCNKLFVIAGIQRKRI